MIFLPYFFFSSLFIDCPIAGQHTRVHGYRLWRFLREVWRSMVIVINERSQRGLRHTKKRKKRSVEFRRCCKRSRISRSLTLLLVSCKYVDIAYGKKKNIIRCAYLSPNETQRRWGFHDDIFCIKQIIQDPLRHDEFHCALSLFLNLHRLSRSFNDYYHIILIYLGE